MLIKNLLQHKKLPENNTMFKRHFKIFAESTSMHGFVELYYAKSWTWKILWFGIIALAFGMTTYQVIRATGQFINQRPATSLELLNPNEYTLPPIKVCYVHWINWLDWEKAYSLNFSKKSILYAMSYITDVFSTTNFDVEEAKKEFLEKMNFNKFSRLTEFYVAVAKSFPAVDSLKGHLLTNVSIFQNIELVYQSSKTFLCYTTPGDLVIEEAKRYKSANVISDNIWNVYLFNFSVQDQHYEIISQHFTPKEYAYYVVWWLKFNSIYWVDKTHLKNDYTEFGLPLLVFPNGYSDFAMDIDHANQYYKIDTSIMIRRFSRTKKGLCLPDEKFISGDSRCFLKCKAEYFTKVCHCPRVSQSAVIQEDFPLKLCTKKIFFIENHTEENETRDAEINDTIFYTKPTKYCPKNEFYNKKYDECEKSCAITGCNEWTYTATASVFSVDRSARKYLFKNQTDIDFEYPHPANVELIVEMDSQSWEDFIGNVGGLLGVWTGASILSFFQLCYLCCFDDDSEKHGKSENIEEEKKI